MKKKKIKDPLIKRVPRELRSEAGKYIVIFLFITMMISAVSGMLVAGGSMKQAYEDGFEKYNIEDGNFELTEKANADTISKIEDGKEKLTVYENFYVEEETKEVDSTVRVFKPRKDVDKVCVMEGRLPSAKDEIAIDRMYAYNNKFTVGDNITLGDTKLKITGLVALSDYSTLYSSPGDMMFDAMKFCVAIMTEDGFDSFDESAFHYSYSWKYDKAPKDDGEAKDMAENVMKDINAVSPLKQFIPQYSNNAIHFAGEDIKGDGAMITVFLYLVVIMISFVFAITTSNTINKEATVIGALRATGYTRGELIRHYLTAPMIVMIVAAIVGNILGYTVLKDFVTDIYYQSYSLPTYVTIWNAEAFVKTTVVPLILLFLIDLAILANKLSLSPLKFLRRDLKRKQKKKAFKLNTKIGIMKRFRLRVIFQNMPNYITIFIGIFFANVIIFFSLAMKPLLLNYQDIIIDNMTCKYQYILKMPMETETEGAEKYCAGSLKTIDDRIKEESATVYGIKKDSKYIDADVRDGGIYISQGFADKYGLKKGGKVTLKEEYGDKKYTFKIDGIYKEPASVAVYMTQNDFIDTFDLEDGYFNGYFSDEEITDIDDMYIATTITEDDLTKTSRQLILSMGGMVSIFTFVGVAMFMLIIYLLSKIIIEKNTQSISMTKILGYNNSEINSLYVAATSIVVVLSLLLTIPPVSGILKYIFKVVFSEYAGYMPFVIPSYIYAEIPALGIVAYIIIAVMLMSKVKKVPLDEALKNVE